MAKQVGDLGSINLDLLEEPGAVRKLTDLFQDERVGIKHVIRVVKPYLKKSPTQASSAKLFAAFLCVFGVEPPFARILLANLARHGQQERVRQHLERLQHQLLQEEASDHALDELRLLQALAAVAEGGVNSIQAEQIYRQARSSDSAQVRQWAGIRLGSLIGVPLAALQSSDIWDAADQMPAQFSGSIVVLAERGVQLETLSARPGISNAKITLYSDDDFASKTHSLDAVLGSYRDKVPDHSTASKRIYGFASEIAQELARVHVQVHPEAERNWVEPFQETLALAYEDHVAAILTKLECFDACLNEVAKPDAIIIAGNSADQLVRMIPYLCRDRSLDNVYFVPLFDLPSAQEVSLGLAQRMVNASSPEIAEPPAPTPAAAEEVQVTAAAEPIAALREKFNLKVSRDALLAGSDYVLLAGHLHNHNYAATTDALLAALVARNEKVLIYDSSHLPFSRPVTDHHNNLIDLKPLVDDELGFAGFFRHLGRSLAQLPSEHWTYGASSVENLLTATIQAFVNRDLKHTVSRFIYFQELFKVAAPKVVMLSTSRWVAVRGLSVIAQQNGTPSIDIQSLNVLRHPKYKAPVATWATVIDQMSKDIYSNYLGFPAEQIFVTGTPRVDAIRDQATSLPVSSLRQRFQLPDDDRPTLLFASQLQPIERCLSILTEMGKAAKASGASLIIKLHPREGNSRRQAYETLVSNLGIQAQTAILGAVPIEEVLAISHTVVTMFSNVAREALLVGREVIIANYFDTELPIRFDLDSGATGAYSAQELGELLASNVANWRPGAEYQVPESAYMKANPHLKEGASVERIVTHTLDIAAPAKAPAARLPDIADHQLTPANAADLMDLVRYSLKGPDWQPAIALYNRLVAADLGDVLLQGLPELLALASAARPTNPSQHQALVAAACNAICACTNPKAIEQLAASWLELELDAGLQSALATQLDASDRSGAILFSACLDIHLGSLNQARRRLIQTPQETPEPDQELSTYLASLAQSLQPTLATQEPDPKQVAEFSDVQDAVLLVDKGVAAEIVIDELATNRYGLVVCEATETIAELSNLDIEIKGLKDYHNDFSPLIAKVVREVAEDFANTFADCLAELLEVEADLDFGHRHQPALRNWMRQALADPTHRCYVMRSVLREHADRPAVLLTYRPTSVANYWEVERDDQQLWFLAADRSPSRMPRLHSSIVQQIADPNSAAEPGKAQNLQQSVLSDELAAFKRALSKPIIPATGKDRVLVVARWHLKTTPPTFTQLVSQMPDDLHTVLIGADVTGSDTEMTNQLGEPAKRLLAEERLRCIAKPALTASAPPEWVADRIGQILIQRCLNSPALRNHGLDMRVMAKHRIGTFVRLALFTLILVDHESKRYLSSPGRSIVAVTPGRHPEAIVAQTNAHALGKQSLDIQVAYWSKSFRYIPPYGTLMSVIDAWSETMIIDHFKMPAEAVHRLGTPRFDAIARQFSASSPTTVAPSGLVLDDPSRPLVTFATQPGLLAQKTLIAKQLCETRFDCGPVNLLIKVHPQDTEQIESYQKLVSGFNSVNSPIIVQKEPMQALINESDVIVTIYSNVGIEAAIMGKRLLVVNLGEDMPLPLDKFNIGANAFSASEIGSQLNRLLTQPAFAQEIEAARTRFFEENAQLLRGDSANAIWGLLQQHLA